MAVSKRLALLLIWPALFLATASELQAQALDLTVHRVGLSLGDSRRVIGVRLNFRDRRLEHVDGVNATIWTPYRPARGVVHGVALGLPLTGARHIQGIGLACSVSAPRSD
ncbi:hypothetical protein [Rhodothermus marinus]|uniref:hypothetical protein n=1 Tax=Rhodothermus marinus TaxID=29549 RepID=UPI0012BA55A3|nr:hypothetical protein [Rhodothermus marinus]BBM73157.1 hypothetical protein RmaAA338_20220 [Rhodothermus marinus]